MNEIEELRMRLEEVTRERDELRRKLEALKLIRPKLLRNGL